MPSDLPKDYKPDQPQKPKGVTPLGCITLLILPVIALDCWGLLVFVTVYAWQLAINWG